MQIPLPLEYIASCILEISSVSTRDYVRLVGHTLVTIRGDKNQAAELKARGFTDAQIHALPKTFSRIELRDLGLVFTKPLTEFQYPLMGYVSTLFSNYEKGNLPFEGPIGEQPAQIMEILNVIGSVRNYHLSQTEQQILSANSKKPKRV